MKRTCPKCGSRDLAWPKLREKASVAEGWGIGYILKCRQCGFIFSGPWPLWIAVVGLVLGPVLVLAGVLMWFDKSTSGLTRILPIAAGIAMTVAAAAEILKSRGKR